MSDLARPLSTDDLAAFERDGFLILRGLAPVELVSHMRAVTHDGLTRRVEPFELEAATHYPGAPPSTDAVGGRTIRRLLQAQSRDYVFTRWLTSPELLQRLQQLLGPRVVCPLGHHNCIMTKQPQFSSHTGWHQDIRYWSFTRPELINAWLALGHEHRDNGCLQVLPGSHRWNYQPEQFDSQKFFRTDWAANEPLLATRQFVELKPGDVLLFHCLTLHAATNNTSADTKYSVVFTFRPENNRPLPGTRSTASPELLLTP